MPEGSYHYGKSVCAHCGRYLKWIRSPIRQQEIDERNKECKEILDFHSDKLTAKQLEFINVLLNTAYPSPKQIYFFSNLKSQLIS